MLVILLTIFQPQFLKIIFHIWTGQGFFKCLFWLGFLYMGYAAQHGYKLLYSNPLYPYCYWHIYLLFSVSSYIQKLNLLCLFSLFWLSHIFHTIAILNWDIQAKRSGLLLYWCYIYIWYFANNTQKISTYMTSASLGKLKIIHTFIQ